MLLLSYKCCSKVFLLSDVSGVLHSMDYALLLAAYSLTVFVMSIPFRPFATHSSLLLSYSVSHFFRDRPLRVTFLFVHPPRGSRLFFGLQTLSEHLLKKWAGL